MQGYHQDHCDICEQVSSTHPCPVEMPGLRVVYQVCGDGCEQEAQKRGEYAWETWEDREEIRIGGKDYSRCDLLDITPLEERFSVIISRGPEHNPWVLSVGREDEGYEMVKIEYERHFALPF